MISKDRWIKLLNERYNKELGFSYADHPSKLEFICEVILDFWPYDSDFAEGYATKAIEVIDSINKNKTYEYLNKKDENYQWYLIVCNSIYLHDKITWGSSIRGAFWDTPIKINSTDWWCEEVGGIDFDNLTIDEAISFFKALVEFSEVEVDNNEQ
jgi:hypothetical protein